MRSLASFEIHKTVQTNDLDLLGHVNNIVYLQWMQEIAQQHWELNASEELQKQYLWVVLSHHIAYKKPCFLDDGLVIRTQVADDIKGAVWGRNVWVLRQNILIAEATTQWCLVSTGTNKPARITKELEQIFITES